MEKNFKLAEYINAPYLNDTEHIRKNGRYPVPKKWLEGQEPLALSSSPFFEKDEKGNIYKVTEFGNILCNDVDYKIGDILIVLDYKGTNLREKYVEITQEHLEALENGQWDGLIDAVLVPHPEFMD